MQRQLLPLLTLELILFCSCTSADFFHSKANHYLCSDLWKKGNKTLLQGEITLETDLNQDEVLKNARQSLNLLIEKQNCHNSENTPDKAEEVEVVLKLTEYSYMKDYQLLNTLSLELLVLNIEGVCLARYYHGEESKDSFFASTFMYKQLEKGFKKLF
jgi:hypothetical protein